MMPDSKIDHYNCWRCAGTLLKGDFLIAKTFPNHVIKCPICGNARDVQHMGSGVANFTWDPEIVPKRKE